MVDGMNGIVELVKEHRRKALCDLDGALRRGIRASTVAALRQNLREVADDPEDFPEPEQRTPYGLKYFMGGAGNL